MHRNKKDIEFTELHIVMSSHENCVSGTVRAAAALCKALGQLRGWSSPSIFGGMQNHDMSVKAQFKSFKVLSKGLACVERVLLIEEARQPLNSDFRIFASSAVGGIKKIPFCRDLGTWHSLPASQQVVALSNTFSPKYVNPIIEVEVNPNENGQVYLHGIGNVMVEEFGMALKCKSQCVPGFVSFFSKDFGVSASDLSCTVFSAIFGVEGVEQAILSLSALADQANNSKAILRYRVDEDFEYVRVVSESGDEETSSFLKVHGKMPLVA